MSHVVRPGSVRLPLAGGHFLDVKRELNAGEYVELIERTAEKQRFARYLLYIVGWSLIGLDGQPLPYSLDLPEQLRVDTMKSLDLTTMNNIVEAIDAHQAQEQRERDARKNDPAGVPASPATLAFAG